jgi:hypothetical protein
MFLVPNNSFCYSSNREKKQMGCLTFMNPCIVIQLWKQRLRCNYIGEFIILSQLYMFRAMFSPIIRSTWLYLQYVVVFTQVAAGWFLGWVETELCGLWGVYTLLTIHIVQFQLIQDTSRQQLVWTLPDTVNTVKCSWWWAKTLPEACTADLA